MSFTYILTETQRENKPNGTYRQKITSIEEKVSSYQGNIVSYIEVKWVVLLPLEYKGRIEIDNFYVGHTDAKKADTAKWKFSMLCKQMTRKKTGEALFTGEMIGKEADVTIQNNASETNGKVYENVMNRVLVQSQTNMESDLVDDKPNPELWALVEKETGFVMPVTPAPSGQVLNDDIPF